MQRINTDVLVIGAGAAGIRAALAASEMGADVVILSKGRMAKTGSTFSAISKGWGIQALIGKERTDQNLEQFYNEIIQIGLGKSVPALVHILVEESGPRIDDLLSFGLRFKKNDRGKPIRVKGCFSNIERAFVTEDYENVKHTFQSILNHANVRFLKGRAIELIVTDHSCWGAWVLTGDERIAQISAKSTILATGGGAAIFPETFAGRTEIGDGYTLASRAGAELINLEYIQFMLGLKQKDNRLFLPLSQLKESNMLQEEAGNDLLRDRIPDSAEKQSAVSERKGHFPFSCRDKSYLIDVAVAEELQEGKKVFWKTDSEPDPLEVEHFSHAFNGGIKINETSETTLPGLFAAGEVAAGPHGADRMGGCMMTATQVFGERAGRFSAKCAKEIGTFPEVKKKPDISKYDNPSLNPGNLLEMQEAIKKSVEKHLMMLRSRGGLLKCKDTLETIQKELRETCATDFNTLAHYLDLRSILTVGGLIIESALKNSVSAGSHFRIDEPIFTT